MCRSWFSKAPTVEKPSPKIRITPEQADLIIKAIQKIQGFEDCFIVGVSKTNSMEPTIDDGMYLILQPVNFNDLIVGDIIMYEHPDFNQGNPVLHRIVDKANGMFETKGDNNARNDPVKIGQEHIKGIWRITIA